MLIEGKCLIKQMVHSRSMTQQMLANKAGIDKRTISFYSTGRRTSMPLRIAVTIADALKCSVTDLYEWKYVEKYVDKDDEIT
jgi:DNA-binding Xre family transcriptional regulator